MCSRKGFIQGKGSWVEGTYLEASISTRLAGNPSRHLTQCATWPALLRAGSGILSPDTPVPTDVDPGDGDDIKKFQDNYLAFYSTSKRGLAMRGFSPD